MWAAEGVAAEVTGAGVSRGRPATGHTCSVNGWRKVVSALCGWVVCEKSSATHIPLPLNGRCSVHKARRVSDQGGGIPRWEEAKVWQYGFTTTTDTG